MAKAWLVTLGPPGNAGNLGTRQRPGTRTRTGTRTYLEEEWRFRLPPCSICAFSCSTLVFVLVGALPPEGLTTRATFYGWRPPPSHQHQRIVRPLAGLCDELANDVTALGVDLSDPYAPALESFPAKCMVYRSPAGSKDAIIHVRSPSPCSPFNRTPPLITTIPDYHGDPDGQCRCPRFARALKTSQGPSFEPIGRAALTRRSYQPLRTWPG